MNNSQLQVGDYLNNLPLDIDSSLRNNPPTIGAKEFSGCSEDAGITRIVSPVSPLSSTTQDIKVELTNHGSTTLTSTTIAWSVNNVLQPPFSWTGSLCGCNKPMNGCFGEISIFFNKSTCWSP